MEPEEDESDKEIDRENVEIRKTLNRLVRKPGKNFTELFENLKTIKGDLEVQIKLMKLIVKESLRFKRQRLAQLIEEHIDNLLNGENKWKKNVWNFFIYYGKCDHVVICFNLCSLSEICTVIYNSFTYRLI